MDEVKQNDQLEHIYNSYVRIRDVAQKTYQWRWYQRTIGKSGQRGSVIPVLAAHDDDDGSNYDWHRSHLYVLKFFRISRLYKYWYILSFSFIFLM